MTTPEGVSVAFASWSISFRDKETAMTSTFVFGLNLLGTKEIIVYVVVIVAIIVAAMFTRRSAAGR